MIYLASASPRRKELLQQIGVLFEQIPVDIDETPEPDELGSDYVVRLAREKALAGTQSLRAKQYPPAPVLGSDTCVLLDQRILGKPTGQREAIEMLLALSGRSHQVITGVALAVGEKLWVTQGSAEVRFAPISHQQALAYWQSGEPEGKAGSYAIQGMGAVFVERITGSYSAVVGLPLYETAKLLREAEVTIWNRDESA